VEQELIVPRISLEDKSAAMFRAGSERRPPPARLSAPAKRLWRKIVDDRPVDFFRPLSYEMLAQLCELTVEQRAKIRALRAATSEEYPAALKSVATLSATLAVLASKLRLTVQADVTRWSGKTAEKGDGSPDPLLGGKAILRTVK
jgi:hypothetical protein